VPGDAAKPKLSFALPALTALALGGCAVVGSAPTFVEGPGVAAVCQSTLGSYSLPKAVLNFKITKDIERQDYFLQNITIDRVPDNQHTFCLDHLRSPLASDEVRVFKNKITTTLVDAGDAGSTKLTKRSVTAINPDSTPFLQLVASKAVDHTAGIIRRIIRVAFTLLSNKGSLSRSSLSTIENNNGAAKTTVVADFQVDPFDYQEMARINDSTRRYGFCFVLEDYTFERTAASANQYCGAPGRTAAGRPPYAAEAIQQLHYLVPKPTSGIFFRPRAAYRLSVYIKNDPDGRGSWRLGSMRNFHMENIMPIVSVGISRAIFATRRTGLVFDDGALMNVCISKGSEIEGGIKIPLDVIYGIVALPSETLIAAISDAGTTKDLLAAQKNLVEAQNQYINFLNKDKATFKQIEQAGFPKEGKKLELGSTAGSEVSTEAPPDAGPIYSTDPKYADALGDICAELTLARTFNLGAPNAQGIRPSVEGNF
jgi:hypothetical protein